LPPPPHPAATRATQRANEQRRATRGLKAARKLQEERHAAANPAAIFSATPSVLRFVFERGIVGITDASAT
jgi:hypothetical protein